MATTGIRLTPGAPISIEHMANWQIQDLITGLEMQARVQPMDGFLHGIAELRAELERRTREADAPCVQSMPVLRRIVLPEKK